MPKKTINRRKKQSNKRNKSKSKKSRYTSIAKNIDKVIDSYFKKDKKTKKRKKRSGTRSGPFKKNPRVELNIEKKELDKIEKDIKKNTDPLIKESERLNEEAYNKMIELGDAAPEEQRKEIIDNINQSLKILKESSIETVKDNMKDFLNKSIEFWEMCNKFPKTKKCIGKNAKGKIREYKEKIKELEDKF
tara:strand:- start:1950 stop:2519 length:570 start_codon:yes stop_codon:yes gene_type:complete